MNASVRTLPTSRFEGVMPVNTVDEWPGVWPGYLCVVIGRGQDFLDRVSIDRRRINVPMTQACVEIHTYRTLAQSADHIVLENGRLYVMNFTKGEASQ